MPCSTLCCCISTRRRSETNTATRCARCSRGAGARPRTAWRDAACGSSTSPTSIGNAALVHWDLLRQDLGYAAAHAAPRARIRHHRDADRRARHRRDHRGVFRHRFRAAPAAAVPRADRLVKLWETHARLRSRSSCRRPTTATGSRASTVFETHRRVSRRRRQPGRQRASRMRVDGRRGVRRPVADARRAAAHRPAVRRRPTIATARRARCCSAIDCGRRSSAATPASSDGELLLDAESYTVIGVMPREFRFPSSDAQFWTPTALQRADATSTATTTGSTRVGRLRAGVTLEQAQAEMDVLAARSQRSSSRTRTRTSAPPSDRFGDEVSRSSRGCCCSRSAARRLRAADRLRQPRQPAAGPRARRAGASWPSAPRWAPAASGWSGS